MFKWFLGLFLLAGSSCVLAQNIVQLTDGLAATTFPVEMSGDGSRIFYFRVNSILDRTGSIYLRAADRRIPELVAEGVRVASMKSNRDGSRLIFTATPSPVMGFETRQSDLYSLDVSSKRITLLSTIPAAHGQLDLADEARTVLVSTGGFVSAGEWQPSAIWSIPWDGGTATRVSTFGYPTALATDSKGEVLYLAGLYGFYRVNTRTGETVSLPPPSTKATWIGRSYFSTDGSTVTFADGFGRIHRYRTDTGQTHVLFGDTYVRLAAVSRDGKSLLVETTADWTGQNPDGSAELFLTSADGSIRRQLTRTDQFAILYGSANAPNDSAFLSDDGSVGVVKSTVQLPAGRRQESIYRLVLATSDYQLLDATAPQSFSLLKVLDDNHLAVRSSGVTPGSEVIIMRSDGSHYRRLPDLSYAGSIVNMSADGQNLALSRSYYAANGGIVREVSFYRGSTGELIKVAEIKEPPATIQILPYLGPIEVRMDSAGQFLAFNWYNKAYLVDLTKERPELKVLDKAVAGISADGKWLLHTVYDVTSPRMSMARTDGSESRALGIGANGELSRDGEWIVFFRGRSDHWEVYLARTDGSFEKRLATPESPDVRFYSAQISADGKVVVITEARSGASAFVAYNQLGIEIGRISSPAYCCGGGQIDSGGEQLYFSSDTRLLGENADGTREIFVARFKSFQHLAAEASSSDELFTGIAVTNRDQTNLNPNSLGALVGVPYDDPSTDVVFTARNRSGELLAGPGIQNPVTRRIVFSEQKTWLLSELFGTAASDKTINVEISGRKNLAPYFLVGSNSLDRLEGASPAHHFEAQWIFPLNTRNFQSSSLVLMNPHDQPVLAQLRLDAVVARFTIVTVAPRGSLSIDVIRDLPTRPGSSSGSLLQISSSLPLGAELRLTRDTAQGKSTVSIPPMEPLMASDVLIIPHVLEGGAFQTTLWIANPTGQSADVEVEFLDSDGRLHPAAVSPKRQVVAAGRMHELPLAEVVGGGSLAAGYLRVRSLTSGARISGFALVSSSSAGNDSLFLVDSVRPARRKAVFPYLAQNRDFFTAYASVNPFNFPVQYRLDIFDANGTLRRTATKWLAAHEKHALLLWDAYREEQLGGYFIITADWPISTMALIGTTSGSALANLPSQ